MGYISSNRIWGAYSNQYNTNEMLQMPMVFLLSLLRWNLCFSALFTYAGPICIFEFLYFAFLCLFILLFIYELFEFIVQENIDREEIGGSKRGNGFRTLYVLLSTHIVALS